MDCLINFPDTENDLSSELLHNFREHLIFQNMAPSTVQVYTYAVHQFFQLYRTLSINHLQLYKVYLLEHYRPQTVNLRIRALNCFLEFIQYPDGRISMIKIQQKTYLDHVISEGDYEYLKKCLLQDEKYLYYFIIRYMAATGARVSELVQIQVHDVRIGYRDIYSKDNKARRLYIPKSLKEASLIWLDSLNRKKGDIFLNRFGSRITPGGIRTQLKKIAFQYHLNPQVVYPHSFRHRFAKSFIERCSDISLLSDLLGHESIETTRIYLRRTSTEQQNIINNIVDW